jgi:hypothetical protein
MPAMAIRFQCPACSQPIEVDDDWAKRAVACPYCRKTVAAPAESTLGDLNQIPMATPIGSMAGPTSPPRAPVAHPPSSNPLAAAALVLTSVTVGLFIIMSVIAYRHSLEMSEMQRELSALGAETSPMKAAMEYARQHGGRLPGWLISISLLYFGAIVACVAGLICGILGLRRSYRRPLAVVSVVACGGVIAWVGIGLLVPVG